MQNIRHLAMLLVLGSALSAQAQKVTLRFNPPVGKSYVYASTTSMTQTTPQGVSKMTQSMNTTMRIVKKLGDRYQVESKISGAKVNATGPGAEIATNIAKKLNGTTTSMMIDSRGRPADMKAAGSSMMQSAMSGMSGGLGNMNSYPAEPVGVGSKWSTTLDFQKIMAKSLQGMKMTGGKIPVNMSLKGFETKGGKKLAIIGVVMKGSFSLASPNPGQGTVTTTMNTTSTLKVDVGTGLAVEVVSSGGGSTSFGQMKMVQQMKTSTKLIKG
jgi:hypothetical protein